MKQQDAVALLKADHKEVIELFKEVEGLSDRAHAQLQKLGDEICQGLKVHAEIEEKVFYPAIQERTRRGHKEEKDLVLESYEEHAAAKKVIADIEAVDSTDESYKPKIKALSELIEHHVKEEESELFPGAQQLFDEAEMLELGRRMAELKERLKPQPARV
jgi:hemerythrin-like domain-containing protein